MSSFLRPLWVLLAVLVIAVVGALLYIDRLLVAGVERGGTHALGVETELRSVRLGLVSGKLGLSGLTVANPEGFETPHFLSLDHGNASVRLRSLTEDTVVIPLVTLRGLELSLERAKGRTNYGVILGNLKKLEKEPSGGRRPPAEEDQATDESKGFVIQELVLEDVTARARLVPGGGKAREYEVKVPEVKLRDIGSDSETGLSLAQLANVLTKAVLKAVTERGGGLSPALAQEIRGQLAQLRGVRIDTAGVASEAKRALGEEVEKRLGGEAAKKGAELLKGLGFGGGEERSGED
jgi:hypothetical protein